MDIMMKLEGDALFKVYEVFKRKADEADDGLSLHEFVACMLKFLPSVSGGADSEDRVDT